MKIKRNNLKYYMEEKQISITDLVHKAKVSNVTVSAWRKAEDMKPSKMEKIAELIGVDVARLFEV